MDIYWADRVLTKIKNNRNRKRVFALSQVDKFLLHASKHALQKDIEEKKRQNQRQFLADPLKPYREKLGKEIITLDDIEKKRGRHVDFVEPYFIEEKYERVSRFYEKVSKKNDLLTALIKQYEKAFEVNQPEKKESPNGK